MSTSISILIHAKPRVMLTTNKQTLHGGRLNLQVQGDHDHEFVNKMSLGLGLSQVVSQYQPWYYEDQIAGYVQQYEKITFMTVKVSCLKVPFETCPDTLGHI